MHTRYAPFYIQKTLYLKEGLNALNSCVNFKQKLFDNKLNFQTAPLVILA